jgi:hypothetical protein
MFAANQRHKTPDVNLAFGRTALLFDRLDVAALSNELLRHFDKEAVSLLGLARRSGDPAKLEFAQRIFKEVRAETVHRELHPR